MLRVGIDMVDVGRVERALERRPRLARRLFTQTELQYAAAHARPGIHLAARFAAKEAVAKALALPAWAPRDIEVVNEHGGVPTVVLRGELAGRARVHISLTHTRDAAAAVAVAE